MKVQERRTPALVAASPGRGRTDEEFDVDKPTCLADGCDRPRRKRQWCEMHYSRWRKRGSVADEDQAWVIGERGDCSVCGTPVQPGIGFRRYCSQSCAVMGSRGPRAKSRPCVICGSLIDLLERYPETGRLRYSSRATCESCRPPSHLARWVGVLAERDGADCSICGDPIDLGRKYPDPMSRSVDHVIPRSRGGRDDLENYALAHFICNVRKNNRLPSEASMR